MSYYWHWGEWGLGKYKGLKSTFLFLGPLTIAWLH